MVVAVTALCRTDACVRVSYLTSGLCVALLACVYVAVDRIQIVHADADAVADVAVDWMQITTLLPHWRLCRAQHTLLDGGLVSFVPSCVL